MAITITTGLSTDFAAFAPVIIEGVTNRHPFNEDGERPQMSISMIDSDGGKLKIFHPTSELEGALAGDTVLIKGLTETAQEFNGLHIIDTVNDPNDITLSTIYQGVQISSLNGTCTRMNDNLMVRGDIFEIKTVEGITKPHFINNCYAKVDRAGGFVMDISKIAQMVLGSQFTLDNDKLTNELVERGSKIINVKFSEMFIAPDFSMQAIEIDGLVETGIAHRTANLRGMFDTKLPMTNMFAGDKVIVRAFLKESEIDIDGDPPVIPALRVNESIWYPMIFQNNNALYVHTLTDNVTKLEVGKGVNATFTPLRDPVLIVKPLSCTGKRLYYLNNEGGFSVMEVHKYEDRKVAKKIYKYTVDSYVERTLFGIEEYNSKGAYLKDLISSPEVYDEDGLITEVLDTDLLYIAEEVVPVVKIKIKENFIQ
jgi:hypothetical protein